jgi:hypothetical protein
MGLPIISEIETIIAVVKALQSLTKDPAVQTDIAGLVSDAAQLKVLFEDIKAKLEDVISKISPELQILIHTLAPPVVNPPAKK